MTMQAQYTSSTAKLLHHLGRLSLVQEGVFKPIMLELAPTNKCDLHCGFCSVANRDKSLELPLDIMMDAVSQFAALGLLSVEVTGGGDPLCHPHIAELIEWLLNVDLEVGLITNGVRLRTLPSHLRRQLSWVRISLNVLDYKEEVWIPKDLPNLGFSYVWNQRSTVEKLDQVSEYAQKYNAKYVRVVPDCLSAQRIDEARKAVAPLMRVYPRFFFSMKGYDKPEECWLGYLRPFLNADGYVYRCSANPLIQRKFHPHFRMCHHTGILQFWKQTAKPFSTDKCGLCFFKEQNELLSSVINPVEHGKFI